MAKNTYYNDIYKMYEEEVYKREELEKENKNKDLEIYLLKKENKLLNDTMLIKINHAIETATKPLIGENNSLKQELDKSNKEIERLKKELESKSYDVDKLKCEVHKDSSNSGIPTSKEIVPKHNRTNTYNHRKESDKKTGSQIGHIGKTFTKQELESKIKKNNIKVKKVIHYINGSSTLEDTIKYKVGMKIEFYVEKHIFKHRDTSKAVLPKEYYSDVTYNEDLKAIIVTLGNYYNLGYSKIKELLYDFSNGIINISEGTINNIYEEFSNKSVNTIQQIITNLLNGNYQHTDETTTKENGKDSYYRGYANKENVVYMYHHHKGDTPIEADNILPNFFGTVISDHEVGIFKYGTNNQDCIYHIGRYCIEGNQNVPETEWQMKLMNFLNRCERTRRYAKQFKLNQFNDEDLCRMEKEYDEIIEQAKVENEFISSSYWKEKENTLLKRLIKYKKNILLYIYDFTIPADNNFMERCLRMIKGKTKVSGGFRSTRGGERFGNTMSIIKTAKLRNMAPLGCIKDIFKGKVLFA